MRFLTSCLLAAALCSFALLQTGATQGGGASAPGPAYPITVGKGGTGATTLTGVLKGNGTSAFTAATAGTDFMSPTSTETKTNLTLNVEGTGNSLTTVQYLTFNAGVCQGTTAGGAGSTPTANAPAATCVTGTNTNYAVYAFDAATDESFQEHLPLPPDQTGDIDLDIRWRAGAITGSTVWGLQTVCVAVAETADPAFNAAQTVTDAAQGVANQLNDASIATVTVTGCAAGEEFFFKFFRDADNVSDDMAGDAQLLWVRLKVRRTQ